MRPKEETMFKRSAALLLVSGLGLFGAACGGGEGKVVDQYFNALEAGDTQTLTSFAAVQLTEKVERHKIVSVAPERVEPAPLPELVKKAQDLQKELDANTKNAKAYNLANYEKLDQVKAAEKAGKTPSGPLAEVHKTWTEFTQKDRELKKAVSEAKAAVEKEKHLVSLSIGPSENADELTGVMRTKDLELSLTIGGVETPYLMSLRQYELQGGTQARMSNRWFILHLAKK
jgi:hypothetical protein